METRNNWPVQTKKVSSFCEGASLGSTLHSRKQWKATSLFSCAAALLHAEFEAMHSEGGEEGPKGLFHHKCCWQWYRHLACKVRDF